MVSTKHTALALAQAQAAAYPKKAFDEKIKGGPEAAFASTTNALPSVRELIASCS